MSALIPSVILQITFVVLSLILVSAHILSLILMIIVMLSMTLKSVIAVSVVILTVLLKHNLLQRVYTERHANFFFLQYHYIE